MSTPEEIGRQIAQSYEKRMRELIAEAVNPQSGIPAGSYSSVVWDGRRVVGLGTGGGGITGLAIYSTTSGQTIPDATDTIVNYSNEISDVGNLVTTGASWQYLTPVGGIYIIIASLAWSAVSWAAGIETSLKVFVDGFNGWNLDIQSHAQGAANVRTLHGPGYVQCSAGAVIDIETYQESGSDQDTISTGHTSAVAIWCLLPN